MPPMPLFRDGPSGAAGAAPASSAASGAAGAADVASGAAAAPAEAIVKPTHDGVLCVCPAWAQQQCICGSAARREAVVTALPAQAPNRGWGPLTKKEFIAEVASRSQQAQCRVRKILEAVNSLAADELTSGKTNTFTIPHLCTMKVLRIDAHPGHNMIVCGVQRWIPRKGKRLGTKIYPSKSLKKKLNQVEPVSPSSSSSSSAPSVMTDSD